MNFTRQILKIECWKRADPPRDPTNPILFMDVFINDVLNIHDDTGCQTSNDPYDLSQAKSLNDKKKR